MAGEQTIKSKEDGVSLNLLFNPKYGAGQSLELIVIYENSNLKKY